MRSENPLYIYIYIYGNLMGLGGPYIGLELKTN
jgi:hypothetical protein